MNENQLKLLTITEFKFYELQVGSLQFQIILEKLGIADPRDFSFELKRWQSANAKLRAHLRSP